MKFHGGKATVAKELANYIRNDTSCNMFFSPFCGACSVERLLVKDFEINFFTQIFYSIFFRFFVIRKIIYI